MKLTDSQIAKLKDERHRGDMAQQVLDNAAWVQATTELRERIISKWATSPITDAEGQQMLRLLLAAHDAVIAAITQTMQTGKMAEISLFASEGTRKRRGRDERRSSGSGAE